MVCSRTPIAYVLDLKFELELEDRASGTASVPRPLAVNLKLVLVMLAPDFGTSSIIQTLNML